MVTLYAGFLERRSAVVSPETPALCTVRIAPSQGWVSYNTHPTTTMFAIAQMKQ